MKPMLHSSLSVSSGSESRKQTKWWVANEVVARMILQTMVAVTGNSFLLYHLFLHGVCTEAYTDLILKQLQLTSSYSYVKRYPRQCLLIEDLFQWLYLQTAFVSPQTEQGCLLWKQLPPELFPPTSTLVLLGGHSLKSLTGTLAHLYIYLIWILYFLINIFAVVVCYRCDWETGQDFRCFAVYNIHTKLVYSYIQSTCHFLMSCEWNSCFGSVAPWLFFCTYTRREGNRCVGARSPPDAPLNPELPKPSSF